MTRTPAEDDALKNVVRTTISLPTSVDARARVKAGRRKFSTYIRELVERDLADDPTLDDPLIAKLAGLAGSMGLKPSTVIEMMAAALVEAAEANGGRIVLPLKLYSQDALGESHPLASEERGDYASSRKPPTGRDAARSVTTASKSGASSKASKAS